MLDCIGVEDGCDPYQSNIALAFSAKHGTISEDVYPYKA
jgi:hypothetical protein